VLAGTGVAVAFGLDVTRVDVPESIGSALALPDAGFFAQWLDPAIVLAALAIAFIASAETLLSAAAVDRMHDGVRTDYNKELRAQGVGNMLCGVAGALPMTGVIVRSSANVQAGAVTRASTMLHGAWILGFVALLPWVLQAIPMAALAAILVVTGWRLVSLKHARHLFHGYGVLPVAIWAATLVMVVATDLLTGVLVGIGLSLLELLPNLKRLRLKVDARDEGEGRAIALDGAATFLTLPKLTGAIEGVPASAPVRLDLSRLAAIDHTVAESLRDWLGRRRAGGAPVEMVGASPKVAAVLR
jgi:MFS superfamily sulfate permease-like transporter